MKKIRLFLTGLLIIVSGMAYAQTLTVTGTVTDAATGEAIAGTTVMLKGSNTTYTMTDDSGKYSIDVPGNGTLTFDFLGYKTAEIAVNSRASIDVALEADVQQFDDVIVVAYGTTTKKSFTGSASVVNAKKIEKRPVSNITNALAGATAGVQVSSNSGQPGQGSTIRVRGVGSINSSSDPLIILDGVPYDGSLSSIPTSDIESLSVLKDAAANSMYGSRGSNGVIMITTKRGREGKTKVNVEIREGFNTKGVPFYETVQDPGRFLEYQWESLRNYALADGKPDPALWASQNLTDLTYGTGGYNPYKEDPSKVVGTDGKITNAPLLYRDNWMKEPYRVGFRQEYIVSLTGGNAKTSFFMSVNYLDEEGTTVSSDFARFAARAKVDHQPTKWFKTGMNISYSRTNQNNVLASSGSRSNFANTFKFGQEIAPIYPIYAYDPLTGEKIMSGGNREYDYGDNKYGMGIRPYGQNTHPLAQQLHDNRLKTIDQTMAVGYIDIMFLKDFKFTANVSAQSYGFDGNTYQTPIGGDALNVNGRNDRKFIRDFSLNAQQLLTYNKDIKGHHIDVLVGHETNMQNKRSIHGEKENFLIPSNPELDNAAKILQCGSTQSTVTLESIIARAQYSYGDRYFLTASYRRDGSSKFHPDVRWGNFWSVGGSWRLDQEKFMSGATDWLNLLKIKASYGTQGNDAIGVTNAYEDQYFIVPMNGEVGIGYKYRGVKDLTWEKSQNFNVGVEFEFLNRIRGSVEYYQKVSKDLLYSKTLPSSMGRPDWTYTNDIDMKNSGVEIELGFDLIQNKNVYWGLNANFTYQKNKLLRLPSDRDLDGNGYKSESYWYQVGGSMYDYYVVEDAGINPENGHAMWYRDVKDANGNVTRETTENYAQASYYKIGKHGLPDWYGGISTSLELYGVDLSVVCSYQIGGWGDDAQYRELMHNMDVAGKTMHVDAVNNRWTAPGQKATAPILQWGLKDQANGGTRFLTTKSAFSIQNVTLGYTFPQKVNDALRIDKLRLYMTGDNLLLVSARKGYDPRTSIAGASGYNYSATRTVSFGINLIF